MVKFVFLFFAFLVLTASAGVSAAKTIYVPDDYAKIRWAVDSASAGDTIIVRDGVHFENIDVNKQLTIRSENGSKNCIVQSAKYDAVFHVTADYANIYGFTIKDGKDGIYLDNVENCNIANNNISNNADDGIHLYNSSNNNITGNSISNNGDDGICLYDSSNNNITGNSISNNEDGIGLYSVSNNNITGNDISNNENGIYLCVSSHNSITGNNISNNVDGIHLKEFSNNNNITGNSISNNENGIHFSSYYDSCNNIITGNEISNNNRGISFEDYSSDNIIYLNNFINNTNSVYYSSYPATNIWSSILQITYTYKGKTYKNYLGNYWCDYTGSDADNDGIGDTPYIIDHDKDHYPLMEPWENYFAPENQPPVANFTYTPEHPTVNQTVTFDASFSYDPDGTIVSYDWDFGDGATASGVVVTHAYSVAGNYTVTLIITDDSGATNSTSRLITVLPPTPAVSVSTDKYEYTAGDVMLINITLTNPGNEWQNVKFLWRLDIPDYNLSFPVISRSLSLPPGFKKTFVIPWRLPKLSVSFNASWYVALYSDGIISEDTADWRYIGAKKKGGGEIAREMAELGEIERSVLHTKLIKSER